ncbi:hypothetical protein ACRAWC_24575 [Leifsonia sp. L25]|uniref:hypothetical protein n=1 Tax=Leifsonia sp. L25 TaxID=3423957 RepID=UPI003D69AA9B
MKAHEDSFMPASPRLKEKHGEEIEQLFGVEVTVPSTLFSRIPALRGRSGSSPSAQATSCRAEDDDMDPEGPAPDSAAYVRRDLTTTSSSSPDGLRREHPSYYHMRHPEGPSIIRSC